MSALHSPRFPRAPEYDRVETEQAEDFVEFWRAGASAKGVGAVLLAAGVAAALWLGLAGLVFGLLSLIHG
jgi:hypothetical protein